MRRLRQADADMTQGVIWRQLLDFAVPMALGLLFQQLYNTVDTIVVGQFVGKEALAAVGSVGSVVNMLVGLCAGLSTGASVIISQCYGAHDNARLHDAVHTTIALTFLLCIAATVVGLAMVPLMLDLMATPADVIELSREYLNIYFAGITGLLIYNMGSGILRAVGDSRRPLYFLCVSALTNIVLDLVFVVVFHWGVAGVAYATIISQFASAVLVLIVLTRSDTAYGIKWRQIRIRRGMLGRIMAIGFPSGIQQAITSFSNVFVQSYINYFGSACMAGWSSYNKLDSYITVPLQAIALASTTFVGQNYGSNNLERTRKGVNQALGMSLVVTAALGVLVMIFSRPCLRLFTADAEVMEYGTRFIMIISPFCIMSCFNQIYAGALRGVGNANIPMIVMLGSFVVFRQVYLLVNRIAFDNSFLGVSLAYPMGWVVCSILLFICYRRSVICHPEKAKAKAVEEVAAE